MTGFYGSDLLDEQIRAKGIEMIAPHRKNRKKSKTQDGRKLRRYNRRSKVECLFACLGTFRRLVIHYKQRAQNYLGFDSLSASSSYSGVHETDRNHKQRGYRSR
jgi:hypothetical protein